MLHLHGGRPALSGRLRRSRGRDDRPRRAQRSAGRWRNRPRNSPTFILRNFTLRLPKNSPVAFLRWRLRRNARPGPRLFHVWRLRSHRDCVKTRAPILDRTWRKETLSRRFRARRATMARLSERSLFPAMFVAASRSPQCCRNGDTSRLASATAVRSDWNIPSCNVDCADELDRLLEREGSRMSLPSFLSRSWAPHWARLRRPTVTSSASRKSAAATKSF